MTEMGDLAEGGTSGQDATMALLAALDPLTHDSWCEVAPDIAALGVVLVSIVFVGMRTGWMLFEAGLPHTADHIRIPAEDRFGSGARPMRSS